LWGGHLCLGLFLCLLGGAPYVGAKVFGLQPSAIGLAFALPAMGYAAGNFLAGRFSVRFGMNPMIVAGTMITTCGMALLALVTWTGLSGPVAFFGAMVALGVGIVGGIPVVCDVDRAQFHHALVQQVPAVGRR
jgi:DHA1 family bicyclomycin/chloramphenicol resistance-like MFS transporter